MNEKERVYVTKPNDPDSEAILNLSELLMRVDNDRELLRELIDIGKVEIPRYLGELHAAVAQVDMKNVAMSAHALKGMLSHLAATRAADAAGHLEQLGRSGDATTLSSAVALFESEIASLMPELEACMTNTRP
jgi:HPt (histidine-containing phosphotransfer) domain-containing protein